MAAPRQRINIELLLGISATFLSLAALIVSVFQTQIAREQQQASVWPYLQTEVYRFNNDDASKNQLQLKLMNNGVGPALIKNVAVRFRGQSYRTHYDVFSSAVKKDRLFKATQETFRSIDPNHVIKAGEEWTLYDVSLNVKAVQQVDEIANDSSFHLLIQYADVYGNCWQLDQGKVKPMGKCSD